MNVKDTILKIKALFAEASVTPMTAPVITEVEPMEVITKDGTTLKIAKMEVGAAVMIEDMAAPDATYTLEDGTEIVVESGTIKEIKPVQVAASAMPKVDETTKKEVAKMSEQIKTLQAKLSAIESSQIKVLEANKSTLELIENFSEQATQKPIEQPTGFYSENFKTLKEKRK